MLTVTQLARRCGISRATVLYYERSGLLKPKRRTDNGYRWYGEQEVARLESIVSYRSFGIPVADLKPLLDQTQEKGKGADSQGLILKNHFDQLESEIERLRQQQRAIIGLLQDPIHIKQCNVDKAGWVEIMQSAGFDEAGMTEWHQTFERMEPAKHQVFLESLGISKKEIQKIRAL